MHQDELPIQELSPDIEWLMHNSQRGDPERVIALLTILITQAGKAALWTAQEMVGYPDAEISEAARRAATAGLRRVVSEGQRYYDGIDLTTWACKAVFEEVWALRRVWRHAEMLPPPSAFEIERLAVLFRESFQLSDRSILEILGSQPATGTASFTLAEYPWNPVEVEKLRTFAVLLVSQGLLDSGPQGTTQSPLVTPINLRELGMVAAAIGGVALIVWIANLINPDPAQAIFLKFITPPVRSPTPTADYEATTVARDTTPLDENSTVEEIQDRINTMPFDSVWDDVYITYYEPLAFNDRPVVWRLAVWYTREPYWIMSVSGPATEPPYYIYRMVEGFDRGIVQGQLHQPDAALITGFEPLFSPETPEQPVPTNENGMIIEQMGEPLDGFEQLLTVFSTYHPFNVMTTVETLPVQVIAGRAAVGLRTRNLSGEVIVEQYFDAVFGWHLITNEYSPNTPGKLVMQMRTNSILFNAKLPDGIINPEFPLLVGYQPDFFEVGSQSPWITPEVPHWMPVGIEPVPAGYDLATADLSFQPTYFKSLYTLMTSKLRIYSGPYWLGDILFLDDVGKTRMCRRSPDGQKLATEGFYGELPRRAASAVTWHDLQALAEANREAVETGEEISEDGVAHTILLPMQNRITVTEGNPNYYENKISDIVFSPDGNRLAVILESWRELSPGGTFYYKPGGIYIADLTPGEVISGTASEGLQTARLLTPAEGGSSLVWSPDSTQVALIARISKSAKDRTAMAEFEEELWVVDVKTGDIVYREPADRLNGRSVSNGPVLTWGVKFPVESLIGLEGCVHTPAP